MKKVDIKSFVEQIARITRERMLAGPVVSLDDIKKGAPKKRPPTLLVIEDDDIVRKSLKRIFEKTGYNVLAACDGPELTEVLYDTAIDLIMLDVALPWIDGYELAQMIKEHKDLCSVPIVFISGHNDQAAIKKGFKVGAHDYITKPFDIEKVKKTVDTLLKLNCGD
ncbi:MAG: transcriptional regulator PhoB-like protein [Bdellovibrionales bacterium RBG_16_40_8]|nr:MAG: transcriptional regulator PhoB-like protein [Bdellovibrionales bacterium RBG_16_40_8]